LVAHAPYSTHIETDHTYPARVGMSVIRCVYTIGVSTRSELVGTITGVLLGFFSSHTVYTAKNTGDSPDEFSSRANPGANPDRVDTPIVFNQRCKDIFSGLTD